MPRGKTLPETLANLRERIEAAERLPTLARINEVAKITRAALDLSAHLVDEVTALKERLEQLCPKP